MPATICTLVQFHSSPDMDTVTCRAVPLETTTVLELLVEVPVVLQSDTKKPQE